MTFLCMTAFLSIAVRYFRHAKMYAMQLQVSEQAKRSTLHHTVDLIVSCESSLMGNIEKGDGCREAASRREIDPILFTSHTAMRTISVSADVVSTYRRLIKDLQPKQMG